MPDPDNPENSEPVISTGMDMFGKMKEFDAAQHMETEKYFLFNDSKADGIHTFTGNRVHEVVFILFSGLFGFTGYEVESDTNFFYDPAAVSAHVNAEKVYDYYDTVFDRDSLDDEGMRLISTVHVGTKWN